MTIRIWRKLCLDGGNFLWNLWVRSGVEWSVWCWTPPGPHHQADVPSPQLLCLLGATCSQLLPAWESPWANGSSRSRKLRPLSWLASCPTPTSLPHSSSPENTFFKMRLSEFTISDSKKHDLRYYLGLNCVPPSTCSHLTTWYLWMWLC